MGNTASKDHAYHHHHHHHYHHHRSSIHTDTSSINVKDLKPDTATQLINKHSPNQKLADVLAPPPSTISAISSASNFHISERLSEQEIYNNLVNQDTVLARVWVAQCKIYGFGTQKNETEGAQALYALKDYKEAYYPLACYYHDHRDYTQAYEYFRKLRDCNHFAQYRLGLMLFHGQGVAADYQKAFHYINLAASNNNKYAQFIMGFFYQHAILVNQSLTSARMWFERSAYQGYAEAQSAVASLLIEQMGLTSDGQLLPLSDENKKLKQQALNWLSKAADQENANALIRLGALFEEGFIVAKNVLKAIDCYQRAIHAPFKTVQTVALAHYLLGINYRFGHEELKQSYTTAFEYLSLSANAGYAPAQRALAIMYAEGLGTPKDEEKAKELLQKAVSQGDPQSVQHLMQQQQQHQKNTHKTTTQSALALFEKAAKSGSLAAQLSLAELLQRAGQHALAFKWFDAASKNTFNQTNSQEHISILDFSVGFVTQRNTARLMVARYRYNGWGDVKKDRLWAFHEFEALSNSGFPGAHYWLAACYEEGVYGETDNQLLVERNLELAFDVYMKSAEAGDGDGQFQVAYMLANGLGVTKNTKAALPWFSKAAEQGHLIAYYSLGLYYETGLDLPLDLDKAKHCYEIAAAEMPMAMVRLARVMISLDISYAPKAADLLQRAIEKACAPAYRELGNLYLRGILTDDSRARSDFASPTSDRYKTAFNYYEAAAEKNDALSWHILAKFYEGVYAQNNGESVVPQDFEKAVACLKKAIDLGYKAASLDLAEMYHRQGTTEDAMAIYKELATSNSIRLSYVKKARVEAAKIIILENYGTKEDRDLVYIWLKEIITLARKGVNSDAKDDVGELAEVYELLGFCIENGVGTDANKEQALRYYIECVEEDEPAVKATITNWKKPATPHKHWAKQRALCRLIYNCMEEKNYHAALAYLDILRPDLDDMSKLESLDAKTQARRMRYFLGFLLLHGHSTERSVSKGIRWLKVASKEGDADAAYELGLYYNTHQETATNAEKLAKKQFKRGASVNHAGCMRELALILLEEEQDPILADRNQEVKARIFRLLSSACQLNDAEAMFQLAHIYETSFGNIIPCKDMDKALDWYVKAAMKSYEPAMIKAGEILNAVFGRHEEAIQWFQRAVHRYNSLKAKVMLIAYSFQGVRIDQRHSDDKDILKLMQEVIQEGMTVIKKEHLEESINCNSRERAIRTELNKDALGLAFFLLGQCYEFGKGVEISIATAKNYYQHSIHIAQNADAMWRMGRLCETTENNELGAFDWYRRAAEKGKHPDSLYQLGIFHLYGRGGLERNVLVAKRYLSAAAEQGHSKSTYELGQIAWNIDGDHLYGYELYKDAGQQHVPEALRELGHLTHTGYVAHGIKIIKQNRKQAFAYYFEAAQLGDAVSALMVGNYFEEGYLPEEVETNHEEALRWYEIAYRLNGGAVAELAIGRLKLAMADAMDDPKEAEDMREDAFHWFERASSDISSVVSSIAQIMVALYNLNGWGRRIQDPEAGFQTLLQLADSGVTEAYIPVAKCYEEGLGTEYDNLKALSYWKMAGEMNDIEALFRLGDFYALGLTGTIDKSIARRYYDKAEKLVEGKGIDVNMAAYQGAHSISSLYR